MKKRWRSLAAMLLPMLLTASCVSEQLHRDGLADLDKGRYESGMEKLQLAAQRDPANMTYRLDLKTRHAETVLRLIADADSARNAGKLDDAEQLYRRALGIEPGNERAARGVDALAADRRHNELMAKAQQDFARSDFDQSEVKLRSILAEDPDYSPALALMSRIDTARGPVSVTPRLRTRDNRPVTLQFRDANTKMVFEALSRQTGINFIFDKDVRSDGKTTIFVQDVSVDQAIDLVLGQNQLARQVLSENMAVIYPNTSAKQKEYQDQIVKTFYLTNAVPKDAENMLKTVLGAKNLFVDEKTNMIMMRDTPESVRMAEKLVASLDLPEPEVMMEVEVLEITRSRLQQLGIKYPDSATVAMTSPSGNSSLTLSDLHKQDSSTLTVTPLSVTLNLLKQTGVTNVLASPRIRARNKEKAKILIGSREPVLTNSVTPTSSGSTVVTGSVQYLDVGLTLEVEPTIHLDNEVAIKVNLEVSSILKTVTNSVSGTQAYEIGTRNANTLLRLKDGETQILAGLIQNQESHSAAEIPGLGDIPILGRLFGSHTNNSDKSEIVLSITPRIVRAQPRPNSDVTEFWYGTESNNRSAPLATATSYNERNAPASAAQLAVATNGASGAVTPAALIATTSTAVTQTSIQQTSIQAPPTPAVTRSPYLTAAQERSATPLTKTPDRSNAPVLSVDGPGEAHVGDEFEVTVQLQNDQPLGRVRAQVRFDATALQLINADAGDVGNGEGIEPKLETRTGGAQLELAGTTETPVQGSGNLLRLHFKALAARSNVSVAAQVAVVNTDGAALAVNTPAPLNISIAK